MWLRLVGEPFDHSPWADCSAGFKCSQPVSPVSTRRDSHDCSHPIFQGIARHLGSFSFGKTLLAEVINNPRRPDSKPVVSGVPCSSAYAPERTANTSTESAFFVGLKRLEAKGRQLWIERRRYLKNRRPGRCPLRSGSHRRIRTPRVLFRGWPRHSSRACVVRLRQIFPCPQDGERAYLRSEIVPLRWVRPMPSCSRGSAYGRVSYRYRGGRGFRGVSPNS